MEVSAIKALTFDVFGTVVDWRGSIIREGMKFGTQHGMAVDWGAFADAWRAGYRPAMDRVHRGELPWTNLDALHRMRLEELLSQFGITGLSEADKDHLNRVWHRLDAWPDAVEGLTRLRRRFVLATLSNGNFALLTNLAKHAGLPWDCILSAELVQKYKPAREVYLLAPRLLDLAPEEVLLVAAHAADLRGAQAAGLRSAWVPRP